MKIAYVERLGEIGSTGFEIVIVKFSRINSNYKTFIMIVKPFKSL